MLYYADIKLKKETYLSTDQLSLEWAGTFKHYHSAMFRTIPIGKADSKHFKMHEACVEALTNCAKDFSTRKNCR